MCVCVCVCVCVFVRGWECGYVYREGGLEKKSSNKHIVECVCFCFFVFFLFFFFFLGCQHSGIDCC